MTNKQYMLKMRSLIDDINKLALMDDGAWEKWLALSTQISDLNDAWLSQLRFRHWHYHLKLFIWLLVLALVVFSIVC